MIFKIRIFIFLLMVSTFFVQGEELLKVDLVEDNILLLDARVQQHHVGSSIDAYVFNDRILIAIEPLFDGLKVKYKIINQQLKIWKDSEEITFNLNSTPYKVKNTNVVSGKPLGIWADDGYYEFIELALVEKIFGATIKSDLTTQLIKIQTGKGTSDSQKNLQRIDDAEGYLFPIQKLSILNEQRKSDRFSYSSTNDSIKKQTITINDQYRLFTPPHGRVALAADFDDKKFNGSVQIVSDLLYHSSNLTMSQSNNTDFEASLTLNRYKESPEDRILGLFDYYSLGDVSGVSHSLTTSASAGVGMVFNRSPENFRRKNLETTLDEIAPPNWDAELFHNGRFISKTEVPGDGRLLYENVAIEYGRNIFEIKLYGPFGEEEVIYRTVSIKKNPLAKGQIAYSINALDKNHNVINDRNNYDSFEITNYGGSIDYGVTDRWQIGASFASIDNERQLLSLKNNFSFNNFLLENDLSFEQDAGYAQLTTVTGSLFEGDSYSLRVESAENFKSEVISAIYNDFSQYTASYSLPTDWMYTNFSAEYYKDKFVENRRIRNALSKNVAGLSLSHTLTYGELKNIFNNTENSSSNYLNGSLGMSGHFYGFNLSGRINYDPAADDPILKSSSLTFRKKIQDPYNNNHYIEATYFPLDNKNYRWKLRHNVAWQSDDFQLTFSSGYDANDEWDLQFGIQFFLGYDYHHNSFIMDKSLSAGSATLDVHSYLDRHANGAPDVLDYNLPNVRFSGNPRWTDLKSGDDGRTILPGVSSNGEFAFAAKWQEGSATLNNDYVVFTHPGAYVDVNMPFFLITDLAGFVVRQQQGEEIGLKNVTMQLLNNKNEVLKSVDTDEDGYFEFLQLMPDTYKVIISPKYLAQKGLTGKIIGTNIATSGRGGFVELPAFVLRRLKSELDHDAQGYTTFIIDEENADALVWSKDKEVNKNYFTLPSKGEVNAKHSLTQPSIVEPSFSTKDVLDSSNKSSVEKSKVNNVAKITQQKQSNKSNVFTMSSVLEKIEGSKTVLPRLKLKQFNSKEVKSVNPNTKNAEEINSSSEVNKLSETAATNTLTGWVIQFSANKLSVNINAAINKYSVIGELFLAQKKAGENQTLNCIISRSFTSKKEAMDARNKVGLKGWITTIKTYSNISHIN